MKNLALAFCSFRPIQLSKEINDVRENEYYFCLQQLERILPESFDLVICENTIDDEGQLSKEFQKYLSDKEIVAIGSEANIGTQNKGMGELVMLKEALSEIDIDKYENISYVTARRLYTCPYVFEKTESLTKDALISNPDVVFLNGKFSKTHKDGLYNDMFFSMKTNTMVEYSNYCLNYIESNSDRRLGSEQLLYKFINENNISYDWLNWLGLIRNDWERNKNTLDVNNFHFC